jgi:tetratricopeptide (TPR) repeat protein
MGKACHGRFIKISLIYFIILFFLPFLNISYIYAGEAFGIKDNAEDYRAKGYEAQQRGDIDTAIEWYQKAAGIKPSYASPHNDLGILFETKGWLDRAEAEYNKALAIDPEYKEVYTNLALLYERKGELEKAAFHWMKRYKLGSPDDPWTQEAKDRLEKLGLIDKTENASLEIMPKTPNQKSLGKKQKPEPTAKSKKTLNAELQESLRMAEERLEKEKVSKQNAATEQKPRFESRAKKDSEWTKIGSEKEGNQVKTSKVNNALNAELQESLRMAEERLKTEKASKQNAATTKRQDEVKTAAAFSKEANISYNKAKDYYNKGEYAKALDTIRLAKQNSKDNKTLLELEEEIKFKMKEERIADYYKEGMIHYRQKDFAGARKEFEAILSILPE